MAARSKSKREEIRRQGGASDTHAPPAWPDSRASARPGSRQGFERFLFPVLILAVIFAFARTLSFPLLNWDDEYMVVRNPLLGPLTATSLRAMMTAPFYYNYYPLTLLSLWLDAHTFGMQAWGFRLTAILLHAGSVAILAYALVVAGARRLHAALLALAFALHPLRVESVVWISERPGILCAFFYLSSIALWLKAEHSNDTRTERRLLLAAVGCGMLALLSKAMAVSIAPVFLVRVLLFERARVRSRLPQLAVLAVASVFIIVMNAGARRTAIRADESGATRFAQVVWAPVHLASKTILPVGLSAYYPAGELPNRDSTVLTMLAVALLGGAIGGAVAMRRHSPGLTFGVVAAALALAPAAGIVGVGATYTADRYSYIPTAMLLVGVGPILSAAVARRAEIGRTVVVALALACAVELPILFAQQSIWSSNISLWQRVHDLYPRAAGPRMNLADAWATEGDRLESAKGPGEGWESYMRALQVFPADDRALDRVVNVLLSQQRAGEACSVLKAALAEPDIASVTRASVLVRLAALAPPAEQPALRADALKALQPDQAKPSKTQDLIYLGWYAERLPDLAIAEKYYSQAIEAEPTNPDALRDLALLREHAGRKAEAVELLRRAAAANPLNQAVLEDLRRLE